MSDRQRPEPERWHLSKGVQVSHILATLAAFASAMLWVTDMRRDLMVKDAQQEARIDAVERRIADDRARATSERGEILQKFNTIDQKLDILMQQRVGRQR